MNSRYLRLLAALAVMASAAFMSHVMPAHATVPSPFDTSFGTNGMVIHDLPLQKSESVASSTISDSDGNLYVLFSASAGNGQGRVSIGKYTSEGVAISAFGTNGRSQNLQIVGANFALQADGKIVVSGFDYSNNKTKIVVYRLTTSGQIDKTFAEDGAYIVPSFPGKNIWSSSLLLAINQSNDRIHLGFNVSNVDRTNQNFYFITLDIDGILDLNWSNGGAREIVPRSGNASAYSTLTTMKLLSDGSLLGIGAAIASNGVRAIVLTKLNVNGYLDATFDGASNGNGIVFIPFGSESDAFMTAATVLQDDSIVLAGVAGTYFYGPWYYGVAKVLADGTVDTAFGNNGFKLSALQSNLDSYLPPNLGVQNDGRYVFAINSGTTGGFMRVETNGTFSNSPNCSQCLWSGANDGALATSVLVQGDGKVIVTGQLRTEKNSVVRRFTVAGTSDGTFNNITVQINAEQWSSYIRSVKPQPDGSILANGAAYVNRGGSNVNRALVYKFTSTGAMDPQFGLGGFQFLSPPTDNYWVNINDFAVLPNGKIVVLGSGRDNGDPSLMMWRLNSNGSLDTTFGTNGFTLTTESGVELSPTSLIVASDGKLLVPLTRSINWVGATWIYRYTANGVLDTTFTDSQNIPGAIKPVIGDGSGYAYYATSTDNGKFFVAGSTNVNSTTHNYLARFLSDGTLDATFSGGYVSWDLQQSYTFNYITNTYVDSGGKIFVLGTTSTPTQSGLMMQLNSDGTRVNSFNGTGYVTINFRDRNLVEYSEPSDFVMHDGMFTIIGGGDSNLDPYRSTNFSGVGRISTAGVVDSNFGTSGIIDPFPDKESYFSDIAPLSNGMSLIAGMIMDGSDLKVLLMKIGPTSTPPTTPPPTTTTPSTTAPQTTTTVPTLSAATDDDIKLVISVSQAAVLKRMKLTVPSGSKVAMKSTSARVCRVVKTKVIASSTGTCRISVTITDKKNKKTTKSTSFKVS